MNFFSWLFSWFKKRQDDRYEVYHPDEVLIYSYWDGSKLVKKDPLRLYKRFLNIKPELLADLKIATSTLVKDKQAQHSHDQVIKKYYELFEVKPFDGKEGLTELAVQELFDHFITYSECVKKNGRLPQTSQTEISPTSPSPTTVAENPTIQPTSGSGSTEKEQGIADWEAVTDGQGEMIYKKGLYEASMRMRNG